MAAMENLRQKLAMAVKSIHWSYAIFWSTSSTEQPGVLTWCDGYYNGDIKTRKTVQPDEMKDEEEEDEEEVGLQRTEQLRQLYESLSAASETQEYEVHAKRPVAALSPEDLSDTEWYFLVCMTFEFSNGQGLPGRTLAKNTTTWLCDAHVADSNVFSRSLLAKSASIQTVVCFPYLEGIVEFGVNEKVLEEQKFIKQIKALISGDPPHNILEITIESCSGMLDQDVDNNSLLEYDRNLLTETRNSPKNSLNQSFVIEDVHVEGFQSSEPSWQFVDDEGEGEVLSYHHNNSVGSNDCISQNVVNVPSDLWSDDDSRYQCVLSKIFKNTQRFVLGSHFRNCDFKESAFVDWKCNDGMEWTGRCSQTLVKKALFEVPKMHENRLVQCCDKTNNSVRVQKHEPNATNKIEHLLAILSSLVPSRGQVDKASLLDDTIKYLKALERKVEDLQPNQVVSKEPGNKASEVRKRKCCYGVEEGDESMSLCDLIMITAIEKAVTIEIRCRWRENMMVQLFDAISSVNLEVQSVQSSTVDGILRLSVESKVIKDGCAASESAKMVRQALERVMGSQW